MVVKPSVLLPSRVSDTVTVLLKLRTTKTKLNPNPNPNPDYPTNPATS